MNRRCAIFAFLSVMLFSVRAHALEVSASDIVSLNEALAAVQSATDSASTIWIEDTITISRSCTIKGNGKRLTIKRAAGFLGDIFSVEKGARLTLEALTVDGNGSAVRNATGALINNAGTATVKEGVTLTNNKRVNSALGAANGGAVTNTGSFTMRGGEISANSAQTGGGGLFNFGGKATLTDTKITGNSARLGGGAANGDNGRLTISGDALIAQNKANQGGGAINAGEKARMTLSDSVMVTDNTAEYGSGIMNASELRLSGTIQIGKDDEDNGLYMGLYQASTSANKARVGSGKLLEGARVNLEGGINHEGDGLILITSRAQKNNMPYFHLTNEGYELTIAPKGSLVLKQYPVEVTRGTGYEKHFTIPAKMIDFTGVTLSYKLTLNLQYTLREKDGMLTVTLKDAFLKNLADRLFVRFEFTNGKAECIFENGVD